MSFWILIITHSGGVIDLASVPCANMIPVGIFIEKMKSEERAFLFGYVVPVELVGNVDAVEESGLRPRLVVEEEEPWHVKKEKHEEEEEELP